MEYIEQARLLLSGLKNDKRAVTALEYALIAGAIAVVILAAFGGFAGKISTTLNSINF